jgi:hypothetical protein
MSTISLVRGPMIFLTWALAVTALAHAAPELKVVSEGAYSSNGTHQGVLVETTGRRRDRSFVYKKYVDQLSDGTELT